MYRYLISYDQTYNQAIGDLIIYFIAYIRILQFSLLSRYVHVNVSQNIHLAGFGKNAYNTTKVSMNIHVFK